VSANEFLNPEEAEAKRAREEQESPKEKKSSAESSSQNRRLVQIMNGEFLSRENFIANLPFTFYLASLLVIVIAWGYYAETVTRQEVKVEKEIGELNAEFFTLGSEYNTMRGRGQIAERLKVRNVVESTDAPLKIKVPKYNLR